MAAQRATAAEKTAPAGSMVMLGDVLRLGRGGSGCSVSGGPGGPGGPGAVDLMGGAPVLTLASLRPPRFQPLLGMGLFIPSVVPNVGRRPAAIAAKIGRCPIL